MELLTEADAKDMIKNLTEYPALKDIDENISLLELENLISKERGETYKITISRKPYKDYEIDIKKNSNLRNLKNIISSKYKYDEKKKRINWKYTWKRYCLFYNGKKILDDNKAIKEFGITQGSILKFSRYINNKLYY